MNLSGLSLTIFNITRWSLHKLKQDLIRSTLVQMTSPAFLGNFSLSVASSSTSFFSPNASKCKNNISTATAVTTRASRSSNALNSLRATSTASNKKIYQDFSGEQPLRLQRQQQQQQQIQEQQTAERLEAISVGSRKLRIYGGSSNPELTQQIANYLGDSEKELSDAVLLKSFSDGERYVKINHSVRGCDVFIVQSTCNNVNDHVMELLLMIDAARRAHAAQVTAVIPYYGYARSDRLVDGHEALGSKLMANLITKAGADRIVVMDIHSPQSCGFFDIPLDHVQATAPLVKYLQSKQIQDLVVVSPDIGGVSRARSFAKQLGDAPLAIIDKRRAAHNVAESVHVIGDVEGKTVVLMDDMIDTAGTITAGAKLLRQHGARAVYAMATHAVFSGPAIQRLSEPGVFEEVIVTNTIPIPHEKQFPQLRIVSVAQSIGDTIWNAHFDYNASL